MSVSQAQVNTPSKLVTVVIKYIESEQQVLIELQLTAIEVEIEATHVRDKAQEHFGTH